MHMAMRLAVGIVACVVAGAASAVSGLGAAESVDLEVGLGFRAPGSSRFTPVANGGQGQVPATAFSVVATLTNRGTDPARAPVEIVLPTGLHWGSSPDAAQCTSPPTVVCTSPDELAPGAQTGWEWHVTADAPGDYVVTAALAKTPAADGNAGNDKTTVTFVVRAAGSSSGSRSVTASAATVTPAHPKAGHPVLVTVSFTPSVRPTSVTCAATAGAARLTGKGTRATGKAVCSFVTPRTAKGEDLRGTVTAKAAGKTFRRAFRAQIR